MWDYTDRQDPTRISSDELKKTKIDDGVRAVTKLKKSIVPKVFVTAVFSKLNPCTEIWQPCSRLDFQSSINLPSNFDN
jgi:tRNA A37 threonylcarbamoyladenosine dehydratase